MFPGAEISFAGDVPATTLCTAQKKLQVIPGTNAGLYAYAITGSDDIIEDVQLGNWIDVSRLTPGSKRIYGISWWGVLHEPRGQDIQDAVFSDFCFELSTNFLTLDLTGGNLGSLTAENDAPCFFDGSALLTAVSDGLSTGQDYEVIYVLTKGDGLVIENVSDSPEFSVSEPGQYTIHSLIYDPNTLDLSIVEPGVTTGFDVNGLLVQGGGEICALLDVAGAKFDVAAPSAGTLMATESAICFSGDATHLSAEINEAPVIPEGYSSLYVLTSGEDLVIQQVAENPSFTVSSTGIFTIHTLVYDPETLDLGIVEPGVTTGVDVNGLLVQGGGSICASLDVDGARFEVVDPSAGTLTPSQDMAICGTEEPITLSASIDMPPAIPSGYELLYVLTSGDDLVIQNVAGTPEFSVEGQGKFTIHTLVYNPETLDLSIVQPGVTTGFDVNGLLVQGGGSICASLDVAGAVFQIQSPDAGTLMPESTEICLDNNEVTLEAMIGTDPVIPEGYSLLYVLTRGEELIIAGVDSEPVFSVSEGGLFTIHSLVYDPMTLDLGIVGPGVTTGFDVNSLLLQGGGAICASLDVAGAKFDVTAPSAGALTGGQSFTCTTGENQLTAVHSEMPVIPDGYESIYVLTKGSDLTIMAVNDAPEFTVENSGIYTIHTLVYDPATLDLGIVEVGVTTGFDVNSLLVQGGGAICASLDVSGTVYMIGPDAGEIAPMGGSCLFGGSAHLMAGVVEDPVIPEGFETLYVLTSGEELVIEQVNGHPEFEVTEAGRYTIHTLIYDPLTLDLSIVVPGQTTGVDVNGLLIQGGGSICASLDVAGAVFEVISPQAGTLTPDSEFVCYDGMSAEISAISQGDQVIPEGYSMLFVLTSGTNLVIEQVSTNPVFTVTEGGLYTIHTLVYDPITLDLSIVVPGETTGVDVNSLLVQGGGSICASLDVAGAQVMVGPSAGTLISDNAEVTLGSTSANLRAMHVNDPYVPVGYSVLYVLTSGESLIIQNVSNDPEFEVSEPGLYTIHTLVYDPMTLDLGIVQPGITTGVDVNGLLVQGGGDICAALDVAGARFEVTGNQRLMSNASIQLQQLIFNDPVLTLWINSEKQAESLINIYDQYGRLLGQQRFEMQTGANQIQVNLNENSPASLYFIQVDEQTFKVVKSW